MGEHKGERQGLRAKESQGRAQGLRAKESHGRAQGRVDTAQCLHRLPATSCQAKWRLERNCLLSMISWYVGDFEAIFL
jgi:hypothetical protein